VIKQAYRYGMAQALLEKVGALIDLSDLQAPEGGQQYSGSLGWCWLGWSSVARQK
jgi:hypothetical protein